MSLSIATRIRQSLLPGLCLLLVAGTAAQQLLDRVLARVGTRAITMTDVQAGVGLGLVEGGSGPEGQAVALQRTIERQLLLDEVARFPPPEPEPAAVAREVQAMRSRAGGRLDELQRITGIDEAALDEFARETLRIRAYVTQRFGTTAQVTEDEVRQYYSEHPEEFTREGELMPFGQVASLARERASAERLQGTIAAWVRDLRLRAEVVIVDRAP